MRRSGLLILATSILLLVTAQVGAQSIVLQGGPANMGSQNANNADVATLPAGDFVVVWGDYGYVYGSKVVASTPGSPFQVSGYSFNAGSVNVDADNAGNFWVAWSEYSYTNARGFNSATTPLGTEFAIGGSSSYNPQVGARRSAGGFVATFSSGYYGNTDARGFDGTGSQSFASTTVSTYFNTRMAVDPVGNFIVVWSGDYLEAATFDPSGTPIPGGNFTVASNPWDFDVAALSTGNFVVTFSGYDYVKAQRTTTTGTSGPPIDVVTGTYGVYGSVSGNSTNFVVVWHEVPYMVGKTAGTRPRGKSAVQPFASGDLGAQAFSNSGTPLGSPVIMNTGNPVTNSVPTVNMNGNNQFTVLWNSYSTLFAQAGVICPNAVAPTLTSPTGGATVTSPVTFQWTSVPGATAYDVYVGVNSSPSLMGTTAGTSLSLPLADGSGSWYVTAKFGMGCPTATSSPETFVVEDPFVCPTPTTPALVAPADAAEFELGDFITFEWTAVPDADKYEVWGGYDGAPAGFIGANFMNMLTRQATNEGTLEWYVIAYFGPGCQTATTETRTLTIGSEPPPPPPPGCGLEDAPLASIVAEATTGEVYYLRWDEVDGASKYHVQESSNPDFIGGIISEATVTEFEAVFSHPDLTAPTPFYYRVAGIPNCDESKKGPYSRVVRVVGLPKPEPSSTNPQVVSEFGNEDFVETTLLIPGFGSSSKTTSAATYSASSNEPWLTVSPPAGNLPPEGTTVQLIADPTMIDLGANTATITVTRDDGLGKTTSGSTTAGVPVTISMVTPVTPIGKTSGPPDNALIIPAVANVSGFNSKWFSDVKITNRSTQNINYELNFSATDQSGFVDGKRTKITIRPRQTVALDDVVRQWYGFGDLADGTNGALEIRPLNFTGKIGGTEAAPMLATVASSRTYTRNDNSLASYGQFIPGVPFSSFLKSGVENSLLMMQQVSQNENFRTNFGLIEGAGKDVDVMLTAYDREGLMLGEFPVSLTAGEHKQLNSILALNGIAVQDGRVTVEIVSGEGAVTSYASVVATGTGDPSLVPGVDPSLVSASKYVLAGVADLRAGGANWRTDARIFNATEATQTVNLLFYPQGETTPLGPVQLEIESGKIAVLEGVVDSLFGQQDLGGALHVLPASGEETSLIVTAETYDISELGKYGQFIAGVTEENAIGVGSPGLEIMQVEASSQFRTNLGLAEVTGQSATVQVQLTIPNSLIAPTRFVALEGNEFQQLNGIVREMAGGRDVYNGRLTVRVTAGNGKVSAYGSSVDVVTRDATFSPGQ